jgi:hypothetical protein
VSFAWALHKQNYQMLASRRAAYLDRRWDHGSIEVRLVGDN